MDTIETIGSTHGSPGDALKLLKETVRLKRVALHDVTDEVAEIASRALGRMLDEEVTEASKLAYTAGVHPSVSIYGKDGNIKLTFDVVAACGDELTVKVDTNTVTDAVEAYGSIRNKDIALHPLMQTADIYGQIKVRIPMSESLQALLQAAAWHYSVPVHLEAIPYMGL